MDCLGVLGREVRRELKYVLPGLGLPGVLLLLQLLAHRLLDVVRKRRVVVRQLERPVAVADRLGRRRRGGSVRRRHDGVFLPFEPALADGLLVLGARGAGRGRRRRRRSVAAARARGAVRAPAPARAEARARSSRGWPAGPRCPGAGRGRRRRRRSVAAARARAGRRAGAGSPAPARTAGSAASVCEAAIGLRRWRGLGWAPAPPVALADGLLVLAAQAPVGLRVDAVDLPLRRRAPARARARGRARAPARAAGSGSGAGAGSRLGQPRLRRVRSARKRFGGRRWRGRGAGWRRLGRGRVDGRLGGLRQGIGRGGPTAAATRAGGRRGSGGRGEGQTERGAESRHRGAATRACHSFGVAQAGQRTAAVFPPVTESKLSRRGGRRPGVR